MTTSSQTTKCYVCEGREPTMYDLLKGHICDAHQREKIRTGLVAKQKEYNERTKRWASIK